jgi:hypothetical protein
VFELHAASVLLQWSTGGLFFCWVTTRHREVSLGYGWLLRTIYGLLAALSLYIGLRYGRQPIRELASAGVVAATVTALFASIRNRDLQRFDPRLDLIAPIIGSVGVVAAGIGAGDPAWLQVARIVVGALFLGAITDGMLLGHWYLVQPGLRREPLNELVRFTGVTWLPEVALLLVPTGMISAFNGTIDDGYGGMLGWFWAACAVTTIVLLFVTRAALKERQYAAVMAATGLLYLAILTAFGTDLVARAILAL